MSKLEQIKKAEHLFSENRLKEMQDKISDEDKERYKKIGEEFYNAIDFEAVNTQGAAASSNSDEIEMENIAQLKLMLNSGIHPSYLNNEEKSMLSNAFGEKWYENFGFLETDLNRINF